MIPEWSKTYGIEDARIYYMFFTFDTPNTMGRTLYQDSASGRWCMICISYAFANRPLMAKAVLWHEFCHAEKWMKDGESDGHSVNFLRRQLRKPVLFLLDYTACRWYNRMRRVIKWAQHSEL